MEGVIAALNFPTVTLVLGVLVIIIFSPQWKALLNRTRKLTRMGWEGHEPQQLPPAAATPSAVAEYLRVFENDLVLEQERSVRADLEQRKITTPADREQVLIKTLATYQIGLHFERVYSAIYGSQVALLAHLNARHAGDSEAAIKPFYDNAKATYPSVHENSAFETYLGYLEASSLIERNSGSVTITLAGREFLKYLVDARKVIPTFG
jgi:hypothetical protein